MFSADVGAPVVSIPFLEWGGIVLSKIDFMVEGSAMKLPIRMGCFLLIP